MPTLLALPEPLVVAQVRLHSDRDSPAATGPRCRMLVASAVDACAPARTGVTHSSSMTVLLRPQSLSLQVITAPLHLRR